MKKTVKYISRKYNIPPNFISISSRNSTRCWGEEIEPNNYLIGELSFSAYQANRHFYTELFDGLVKNRKSKKRNTETYEWKDFLLFLFSIYQKATNRKLLPKDKARTIKVFLEDFELNVSRSNQIDNGFKLSKKADKLFYIKRRSKTFLLGFLINKTLFITFPQVLNFLTNKYFDTFAHTRKIGDFHSYLVYLIYKKWGVDIKTETKVKKEITLGADPEFLIYNKYKKNPKLADYTSLQPAHDIICGTNEDAELGLDGYSTLGELRPRPSSSPYTLARNIKGLFNKFYSEYGSSFFLETGGGCEASIGGHIHIGHEIFKNLSAEQVKPLMQLLDAFLYYPIKLNMHGAVREWRDFNELDVSIDYDNGECRIEENPEKIIQTIKKIKPIKSQKFNGFDTRSQQRSQPHGLEYRSLPSFIGDFTFTKLVLKLAKGIAEKYIDLRTQEIEFTYNDPPQKEDYLIFLKEKEVNQLFEYLYGKKKDLFLKNALENWKVIKQFYITIADNLNIFRWLSPDSDSRSLNSEFETSFTKKFQSVLKDINHSLKISLLPAHHYFISDNFETLTHPFFIITPHVNFSTLTEGEFSSLMTKPNPYTICIGLPQLWRDRGYITSDKKNITQIIIDSIKIFQLYHKTKSRFKLNQTLTDLKKIPLYNNLRLTQIAEEIIEYNKCFKKTKKKDTPKIVRTIRTDPLSFEETVRRRERGVATERPPVNPATFNPSNSFFYLPPDSPDEDDSE